MQNIYTIASSSSSTTYGNVMAFVKERISQCFPIGFFKDVHMGTEIAYVNMRRRIGRNTLKELSKLERPFMVINPQIQPPSGDMYLYDIPLTKNFDNIEYGVNMNTLFIIIDNVEDEYILTYKLNRDKIQFEISITVDTLIQQLDLYKYMVNHFTWERPFTVKTSLESMIPREMIKQMGLLSNINIDNVQSNQIPIILKMLNRFTKYPITYKIRNGTSTDEFFMYYNAEVLLTFDELSLDNVNRKGFADDFYQIRFNCSAEFNLPGAYALVGKNDKPKSLDIDLVSKEKDGYHDLIPLFTIDNFFSRYSNTRNGFKYFTSTRFKTERGSKLSDCLAIDILFEDWQLEIISRYYSNNIPMDTLIEIIIVKDGEELKNGNWNITWHNMTIELPNSDDNSTYQLIIYINNNLFSEEYIDREESEMIDKPKI